jgi:hypothetical protein
MTQIKKRPNPKIALVQTLYDDEILIEKECIAFLGQALVEKAKRLSNA